VKYNLKNFSYILYLTVPGLIRVLVVEFRNDPTGTNQRTSSLYIFSGRRLGPFTCNVHNLVHNLVSHKPATDLRHVCDRSATGLFADLGLRPGSPTSVVWSGPGRDNGIWPLMLIITF
jgi:hypothetical protein